MNFYDSPENVQKYLEIAEGYDGRALYEVLKKHLPKGSSVLEIGMGPGKDVDIFSGWYKVTGSDRSEEFLKLYKEKQGKADILNLDAVTIETDRRFDCVFSNKVLMHLSSNDLKASIKRQWDVLNEEGLVFHSFWYGSGEESFDGLRFTYYDEVGLVEMFSDYFDVVEVVRYEEFEAGDSVYLIGRKL